MIGESIGKYRILDRIGKGGMGTVYRAVDDTLHRDVAIKVLNAGLDDPEVARRFRSEAITVARLNHPGIATVFELFEHDSRWLMVMEFVRGETLEALVERAGALPPERAAELCLHALTALGHAHGLGVVHRDLKPANLMLTEAGVVKVMDFGIARVSGSEHLTGEGFMMGTPAYMAPEQVLGHETDSRADLYAMGVVFYRLVTGKLPFGGETPFAIAQSQVNDPPTPILTLRSDLPPWVDQIVSRALAKRVDDRFQSAAVFHEALSRCLGVRVTGTVIDPAASTERMLTPAFAMPTGTLRDATAPMPAGPVMTGVLPPAASPLPTGSFQATRQNVTIAAVATGAVVLAGIWFAIWTQKDRAEQSAPRTQPTQAVQTDTSTPPVPVPVAAPPATSAPGPSAAQQTGSAPANSTANVTPPPAASTGAPALPDKSTTPSSGTGSTSASRGGLAGDQVFQGFKFVPSDVSKYDERDVVTLLLSSTKIRVVLDDSKLHEINIAEIRRATYTKDKGPQFDQKLFCPPPAVMTKRLVRERVWLVLQTSKAAVILRLDTEPEKFMEAFKKLYETKDRKVDVRPALSK